MYIFVMFQHLYTGPSQNHFILCNFVLAARERPQAFRETLSYTLKRQYIRLPLPVTKNARVLSMLDCPRNAKARENVWRTLVFRFVGSKIPIYWAEFRVCISPLSKVFQGSYACILHAKTVHAQTLSLIVSNFLSAADIAKNCVRLSTTWIYSIVHYSVDLNPALLKC